MTLLRRVGGLGPHVVRRCVEQPNRGGFLRGDENHGQVRGSRRLRKPQVSMGVALSSGILDKRHRYDIVASDIPVFRKTLRLRKASFGGPHLPACSMDLKGVSSVVGKEDLWSPKADSIGTPAADLFVARSPHPTVQDDWCYCGPRRPTGRTLAQCSL